MRSKAECCATYRSLSAPKMMMMMTSDPLITLIVIWFHPTPVNVNCDGQLGLHVKLKKNINEGMGNTETRTLNTEYCYLKW